MALADIAPALHALPRSDKLMALQLLAEDLAAEDAMNLKVVGSYPIFTPETAPDAERVLLELLEQEA